MRSSVPASLLRSLEEFRYRIRHFLAFSREAARAAGLEPQQHQMLLVLAGRPGGKPANVRQLAERLLLRHNSAVELVNRLEKRGLVRRTPGAEDRREVRVQITGKGSRVLQRLSRHHLRELRNAGPELVQALRAVMAASRRKSRHRAPQIRRQV
jgi:DNA-binding MarR family transcriptional regulator